jgi:hypothetical protein
VSSQLSSLSSGSIKSGNSDSWSTILEKAIIRDQISTGISPTLRSQNGQVDLNHGSASSSMKSQKSPLRLGSNTLGSSDSLSARLFFNSVIRDQPSTGISSTLRRQNGQDNLNHENLGKNPAYSPAASRISGSSSISSQMPFLSTGSFGSWDIASKKSATRDQPSSGIPSNLRRQNGLEDLTHYNHGTSPAKSPGALKNRGSSSVPSQIFYY